jgi:polygalacturonase
MKRRELFLMGGTALPLMAAPSARAPAGRRTFDVREFGATADGVTKDTASIQKAIDTCFEARGGMVYLPPGVYHSGGLVLKSNMTFFLEAGATLLGSKEIADYVPREGPPLKGDANQKHFLFARDAENLTVAGAGTIDGQGRSFWRPSGRAVPPPEDDWKDVATYDWAPNDRASPMLEFVNCKNLRIEDVTLQNASGWTLRPIGCESVIIRGIKIRNPVIGPNTDGIDPTCCQNVFISDCDIRTGDDTICLKSENPYGPTTITKNIVITNCVLSSCCNGLKFGTATRGGFENITFSNSVIYNEAVNYKERVISGIAVECVDGGWVNGVVISNVRMHNVRTPIFIRLGNRGGGQKDPVPGTLRGVMINNVHATGAILTCSVTGLPGHDVEDVTLSDIRIDTEEGGKAAWSDLQIPELPKAYPEARMFGRLPSYGFYCRHVNGIKFRNVGITTTVADERPALVCDDVQNLSVDALAASAPQGNAALMRLVDVRGAFVRGCSAPAGSAAFLRVEGPHTADINIMGNDLSQTGKAVDDAVSNGAVFETGNRPPPA